MFLSKIKDKKNQAEEFGVSAKALLEIDENIKKNKELTELSIAIAACMDEMVNDKLKNILI
jgi:hypothetical protein